MGLQSRLIFILTLSIVALVGLIAAFSVIQPTPPRMVVMSTGPEGSAYEVYAEQYREYFAANGITLELRNSGGAQDNLAHLSDPGSDVDVAFITMGSRNEANAAELYSLGAMFLEPLWVFTIDEDIASRNLAKVAEKKVSIGPPGSRSNTAARQLFGLLGFSPGELLFLELDPNDSTKQLKKGDVDAVIMVTNATTPLVKELLASAKVQLVDFERADAYAALYPQLKKLMVPAGVGSLAKNLPPEDVRILSFTAILAVRKDIHPAIQTLLLDAASQIHSKPDLFHADGSFPSADVFRLPLSSSASRYYTSGPPILQRFLPFWLAILVMQVLVAALPLLGLIYPALKFIPTAYQWAMRKRIFNLYRELRMLESQLPARLTDESREEHTVKLDALELRVRNLKVPTDFSNLVFALRSHINVVKARLA